MLADHSRRRFLRTLTFAGLALPAAAQAAEERTTLEILVDKGAWGDCSLADIHTVVVSAAEALWQYCPGQRLRPIRVYHRPDFPFTDFGHDWGGRIRIGLACEDRRWAQMAFQFGHEFCHALAQHSFAAKRSWHPPQHSNLWFEESLCETAALFVLRRLSATWRTRPPAPLWQGDAEALANFATERLAKPDHQLSAGQSFTEWFRSNEPALRENAALRAKNVIIARQMLPLFEATPAGWGAVPYLNLGKRQKHKPLAQYFAEWQAASPAELRPFLARVAALF
jgi:hypothetical protein